MIGQFAEMPNVKINKTRSSLLRHSVCTKTSEKYFLMQTSHSVLAPSSLGLYKNFREILSCADLALGLYKNFREILSCADLALGLYKNVREILK